MKLIDTNSPRACPRIFKEKKVVTLFSFEGTNLREKRKESGGNGIEDPPVPIPNTEVKLNCVDGTWRVTARESRTLPDYFFFTKEFNMWLHGQAVKTPPFHGGIAGSIPAGVTIFIWTISSVG